MTELEAETVQFRRLIFHSRQQGLNTQRNAEQRFTLLLFWDAVQVFEVQVLALATNCLDGRRQVLPIPVSLSHTTALPSISFHFVFKCKSVELNSSTVAGFKNKCARGVVLTNNLYTAKKGGRTVGSWRQEVCTEIVVTPGYWDSYWSGPKWCPKGR